MPDGLTKAIELQEGLGHSLVLATMVEQGATVGKNKCEAGGMVQQDAKALRGNALAIGVPGGLRSTGLRLKVGIPVKLR